MNHETDFDHQRGLGFRGVRPVVGVHANQRERGGWREGGRDTVGVSEVEDERVRE